VGKVWVLDTETKGTGAHVAPLKDARPQSGAADGERFEVRRPAPRREPEPRPREPRRFRVTDVMTRQVLVDGAGARVTVEALGGVRSVVDVLVEVWDPEHERWRSLTHAEQRRLWDARTPRAPAR
jgi:hypothetical protein